MDMPPAKQKKSFLKRFWWILLIPVVVLIIVMNIPQKNADNTNTSVNTFVDSPTDQTAQTNTNTTNELTQPQDSLPSCNTTKELFTVFPLKDGDFYQITALGNLNPTGHTLPTDHLYVATTDAQYFTPGLKSNAKPLIAPADMWIVGVQSSEESGGITDYSIEFSPCKEVKGKFGHIGSIAQNIQAEMDALEKNCNEYETGGKTYRSCSYMGMNIEVNAGEEIGTVGDGRSAMLDIWLSDYREPQVNRANPDRWSTDRNFVSCFLDYYPTEQKDQYYDLIIGPDNGKRTKEPRCGTVDVDIVGTAQGVWFYDLQGQLQGEDPHLALAYDNIQTDKQVFSVGTSASSAGIESGFYSFVPASSGTINRDFSQVTADGTIYCYDTTSYRGGGARMSILATMPTAETLRIKKNSSSRCGTGPWDLGENFVEYER
ncbi:MAG: hypothetical protein HZC01_02995 [Candidatus Kerfeldbacteria bacterium]|nr:hypothetical protein [Candidatus Kerfeldbacteria bacterium]